METVFIVSRELGVMLVCVGLGDRVAGWMVSPLRKKTEWNRCVLPSRHRRQTELARPEQKP